MLELGAAYCARKYFDDYTRVSVFSHVSLADFFSVQRFEPVMIEPRFMPFSLKSRLPVVPWLSRSLRPCRTGMGAVTVRGQSAHR